MARSHGPADKLGNTSIERRLASLEAGTRRTAGTRLLTAHTESATGTLTSGVTTPLSLLAMVAAGRRAQIIQLENSIVLLRKYGVILIGTLLPIKHLC